MGTEKEETFPTHLEAAMALIPALNEGHSLDGNYEPTVFTNRNREYLNRSKKMDSKYTGRSCKSQKH